VLAVEPGASLVLGWRTPDGQAMTTWAFVLERADNSTTRLITRCRANPQYPFFGLPRLIGDPIVRAVHFVMQRKQLLGIAHRAEQFDVLLDRLLPEYDIVERHRVWIDAAPEVALEAAEHVDLKTSMLVRTIVALRAIAMGANRSDTDRPHGLVAETTSMGWRVLADIPGREIVLGAATQPWLADVTFRPLAPEAFASFDEPGYVKIAWTLRVDPAFPKGTIFQTETRAQATDPATRDRFRRYWSRVVPGVVAIRWILLRLLKKAAEANQLQSLAHGRTH
jgi:hypothetical protein